MPKRATLSTKKTCKDCMYSVKMLSDTKLVMCHRYPLTSKASTDHWCGEYKSK